ncbi:RAMP superfamily CRISPR-associated protein [Caldivirga sp.]|uniref:RAMP superfamily CRISPR-associated protein n=1 Tax=Caldivirga sp. TaxID=2080243 RepID=UPI003D11B277
MTYVELNLTLDTPFLPGSADPNRVDLDWPLRPSEVKGIWRWWARALVAGALFERGLLHGKETSSIVKVPTSDEAVCISRIVGLNLGLGYAGERNSRASCFKIIINPDDQQSSLPQPVGANLANRLQRIRLLTLGRRSIEYVGRASIRLIIDDHMPCGLDRTSIEASLSALALALKFSCFGKGGRRGLGCFSVRAYGPYSGLFRMDDEELINYAVESVGKVVDSTLRECRLRRGELSRCELPPTPIISKGVNYIDCIENNEVRNSISKALNNALHPYTLIKVTGPNVLDTLHNFFLRPRRTITLLGSYHVNDDLRATYNAWVLGLPREQKEKDTGYMIKTDDVSRRASPFIVSVHGNGAYVSAFTSADWPTKLEWHGAGSQNISVDQGRVINATAIALKEMIDYLSKSGLQVVRVWP